MADVQLQWIEDDEGVRWIRLDSLEKLLEVINDEELAASLRTLVGDVAEASVPHRAVRDLGEVGHDEG